jgi:hypothetical protein
MTQWMFSWRGTYLSTGTTLPYLYDIFLMIRNSSVAKEIAYGLGWAGLGPRLLSSGLWGLFLQVSNGRSVELITRICVVPMSRMSPYSLHVSMTRVLSTGTIALHFCLSLL